MRTICLTSLLILLLLNATTPGAEPPAPEPPRPPRVRKQIELPDMNEGRIVRQAKQGDYRVEINLSRQSLRIDLRAEESWRTAGEIRRGDTVSVTTDGVPLMAGRNVLARLKANQVLPVTAVKDDWIGTAIVSDAQRVGGWVQRRQIRFSADEAPLHPTLAHASSDPFVSASVLTQKAKQFDDGLYAAIELAAQNGAGNFAGKRKLLEYLATALNLTGASNGNNAALVIHAATRLGELSVESPVDGAEERLLDGYVADFRRNALRSKPVSFYTWSKELSAIFQQDRMLQTALEGKPGIESLARSLHGDQASRNVYEGYLRLVSRLTNPLAGADLRRVLARLDEGSYQPPLGTVHFFPPSRSHETDLVKRLFSQQPVPEGFNLFDALIKRIRSGEIDLTPTAESGWYDYVTWAQEPLLRPEAMPEAARLQTNDEYRKQLEELFKGALALARETHIKQLEPAPPTAAPPPFDRPSKLKIFVSPQLDVEPLASVYLRRAQGYRFVRQVLEETFGGETFAGMHRLTAAGPVRQTLADELASIEALFHGAYAATCLQLGMTPAGDVKAGSNDGALADAGRFAQWAAHIDTDPDVGADARMMVPVFYDLKRRQLKAWLFLGWVERDGYVTFARKPAVRVFDKEGQPLAGDAVDLQFHGMGCTFLYPVTAEVYVPRLMNRDEFRRHCDTYRNRSAILANL